MSRTRARYSAQREANLGLYHSLGTIADNVLSDRELGRHGVRDREMS
jgi:hypothetical protein